MPTLLDDIEVRVLGVLMEKALTQASSYPLTLNALTLGCSQSQNRDPVLSIAESDVSAALRRLEAKALVAEAAAVLGARSRRYAHKVDDVYGWDAKQQAVMAELMLRGPQTEGELRNRAKRMAIIPDLETVSATLDGLMNSDAPFVEELPREPGRSVNRYRHLLCIETADESKVAVEKIPVATTEASTAAQAVDPGLAARVAKLEEHVAALQQTVDRLDRVAIHSTRTPDITAP